MRNSLFFLMFVTLVSITTFGQEVYIKLDVEGITNNKISKNFADKQVFKAIVFKQVQDFDDTYASFFSLVNERGEEIEFNFKKKFAEDLNFTTTTENFWQIKAIEAGVYSNILENGYQYDVRSELEEESLDYLNYLNSNGGFLEDAVIKDYLQSIFLKIYKNPLNDGRLGQLDIRILNSDEPYAAILPNGTALISIGIMNLVNSEEELTAILAHETAHFVLDHTLQNINSQIKRQKRAEFWSGVATVAVAAASTYVAAKKDIYFDPSLTLSAGALVYSIASEINERIGLKYSREQEMEADNCSAELMEFLGYDKTALGSVFVKLRDYYYYTGNFKVFSDKGTLIQTSI